MSIDETCEARLSCRIGTAGRLRASPGDSAPDQKVRGFEHLRSRVGRGHGLSFLSEHSAGPCLARHCSHLATRGIADSRGQRTT